MSKFITQLAIAAAMTVTVLGSSVTASQAAGAVKIAPIAAEANVSEVGYRHRGHRRFRHFHGHYRPHYRPHYSSYYRPRCFWTKRKVWSNYYGYRIWKRIKVCR